MTFRATSIFDTRPRPPLSGDPAPLSAPRPVRLVTNGREWRVEVYRRSWLRFGLRAWCYVEFGGYKTAYRSTANESIARARFAEVVTDELRRHEARTHGWRVVEGGTL